LVALRQEGVYKPELREHRGSYFYRLSTEPGTVDPFDIAPYWDPGQERTRFAAIANTELGHRNHRDDALHAFYEICKRDGINTVLHCGDLIAGEISAKTKNEVLIEGPKYQTQHFIKNYPQVPGIDTFFITAPDCEGTFIKKHKMMVGPYIERKAREAGRTDLHYVGHGEQDILMPVNGLDDNGNAIRKQARVRMGHLTGRTPYARSYPAQKMVESIQGGTKPHVLLLGHLCHLEQIFEREVWTVQVGGFKDQSSSMRNNRQSADIGGYICELMIPRAGQEVFQDQEFALESEAITFFNRDYYLRSDKTYRKEKGV